MFKKITNIISVFKNLENIKKAVSLFYTSIIKVNNTLKFVQTQLSDVSVNNDVKTHLAKTIEILDKAKQIIEKYGSFIGFSAPVSILQNYEVGKIKNELVKINDELDELL